MTEARIAQDAPGPRAPARFDVVVIATSAGGLAALTVVLAGLPADFPAAVVVVQHLDPKHRSMMSEILGRKTLMPVTEAKTGEVIGGGRVYLGPPDEHLLVQDGRLQLTHEAPVHFLRPSADLLFESAAESYGARVVAVVLTGTGSDGTDGARAIKEAGGIVIAQDEATSQFFGMPGAAAKGVKVDYVLPLGQIAPKLIELVGPGA